MSQEFSERVPSPETPLLHLQKICDRPICINDLKITILSIHRCQRENDWHCSAHTHDFYEHLLVTDGTVRTFINGTEMLTHPGQYFVVPPGLPHYNRVAEPDTSVAGYSVRWSMEKIDPVSPNCIPMADDLIGILSGIYTESVDATSHDKLFYDTREVTPLQQQHMILEWLLGICGAYSKLSSRTPAVHRTNVQDKTALVRNVILNLEIMYARDVDVSQIARDHNISYSRLSRIFKEVTGATIIEHLTAIRVQHAKELLLESDLSIREISSLTGFNDPYYFSKVYKRAVGVSPGRSRIQMRTNAELDKG